MVSQIPVMIWLTSTSMASEPKKYQKFRFFGAGYLAMWSLYMAVSGNR